MMQRIVTETRAWIDTPFHHAAHIRGAGCDCVGLVIGVAKALGYLPSSFQPPVYSAEWHVHRNEELLRATMEASGCVRVPLDARQPDYVVHAKLNKTVVQQRLVGDLRSRLRGVYTFPRMAP
jgi:hypothetical protein